MISLIQLLKESIEGPKAIILAGAPGAGKGYVLKGLNLNNLKTLNIDKYFIDALKKEKVSLDLKTASPEDRSKSAKAMGRSHVPFKAEQDDIIEKKESFILDGTSSSYKNTVKLKDRLEEAGYEVFMLYVYTDLERSLKQNQDRFERSKGEDRSLPPAIVLRTWASVTQNYQPYKELFGDNFVLVANTLEDKLDDIDKIITKYLTPFKPTDTKPKTPSQAKRSKEQYLKMKEDVQKMLNSEYVEIIVGDGLSKEEAQTKLKKFLGQSINT